MGIKDQVADVTAQTTDIGAKVVTNAKLSTEVGRWWNTTFGAPTTTVVATFLCTASVTFLDAIIQITAAGTNGSTLKLINTSSGTLLAVQTCSSAYTHRVTTNTATTTMPAVLEVPAGASLYLEISAATTTLAGKLFLYYIATPT